MNARKMIVVVAGMLLVAGMAQADVFGTDGNQFNIDFVTISGSTNPISWHGIFTNWCGIVNNDYRMGTYEVTNDQWNKFKNSLSVPVTGSPSYAYNSDAYYTGTNVPISCVSWYEAAQFVNWLNTSTGHQAAYKFTGTQGTADYTLATWDTAEADNGTNLYRNKDAKYYLPTENEWVKAAYWNGTMLQTYATTNDASPIAGVDTNYNHAVDQPWNVGSGSQELNGTYDIMGNVREWMESPYNDPNYGTASLRGVRGGEYYSIDYYLTSSSHGGFDPYDETNNIGFRVASEVPEPATMVLLALGGIGLLRRRK